MTNISPKIVFKMLYFTLNNININFLNQNLNKSYILMEIFFLITKKIKLIEKKEFANTIFNLKYKIFFNIILQILQIFKKMHI